MVCSYNFTVEHWLSMSKTCLNCTHNIDDCYLDWCIPTDGVQRLIITINRMLPGPTIDVCQGDTISVNVKNMLALGEGTTIHWHGFHQLGTPYMDGTQMISQCPILQYQEFEYR
jgi:L-ascorbate oxidase